MDTTGVGMDKSGEDKKKTMHRIKANVHQRLLSALNLQEVQKFPLQHNQAKVTTKQSLMLVCKECGYTKQRKGVRLKKLELVAGK